MHASRNRLFALAIPFLLVASCAMGQSRAVILSEDIREDVSSTATNLTSVLAGFGITAETRVPAPFSDPGDMSDALCVFDLRVDYALDPSSVSRLGAVAAAGGGLYFAGEHPVFAFRNDSVSSFIASEGGGPVAASPFGVPAPAPHDIEEPVNPDHPIASTCNDVTIVTYDGVANGQLVSLGNGTWLTGSPFSAGAATWDTGALRSAPNARLVFALDVNYLSSSPSGTYEFTETNRTVPTQNAPFAQNMVQWLCTRDASCACAPYNHGWWHRVCLGTDQIDPGRNGQGNGPGPHPNRDILDQAFLGADAFMAAYGQTACQSLDDGPFSDERLAALRELATLELNLRAGFLSSGCPVELHPVDDTDGLVVRDAIRLMQQRLLDGSPDALREARWIGEHVANREALK